ncbi:hypothetical protein BAE44_0010854, partial [Dichanthelium oligosanthes]
LPARWRGRRRRGRWWSRDIRLNDDVYVRLHGDAAVGAGCTSSGSDHDASAYVFGRVEAFLETDTAAASMRELLDPPAEENVFRIRLAAAVAAAVEAEVVLRAHGRRFGEPWRGTCAAWGTT